MTTSRGGIPDWDLKLFVLLEVFGGISQLDLADRVLEDDPLKAMAAAGNFRKWRMFRPRRKDGPKIFFERLPKALGCAAHVTGKMLIDSSIEKFVGYFPDDEKKSYARELIKKGASAELSTRADKLAGAIADAPSSEAAAVASEVLSNGFSANFRTLRFHSKARIESIETGISAGQINQRHYYLTPDAASTWTNLVRAASYPTYDHCKAGLRALVDGQAWRNVIAGSNHRTVAMLAGGGAPTKDIVLINSLLHAPALSEKNIDYVLIDYSYYMLITSHVWLDDGLAHLGDTSRVTVWPIQHDIMHLKDCKNELRLSENVIFGLTGGTIGNLNEAQFFTSLDEVARKGDLLILSADTLPRLSRDKTDSSLLKKYNHAEMRRFILPAVRATVAKYDLAESVSSVLNKIRVEIVDAKHNNLSTIEQTRSVTLNLDIQDKPLILLSSTRYVPAALEAFAKKFGWFLLDRAPSPLNTNYVQFLFQRN